MVEMMPPHLAVSGLDCYLASSFHMQWHSCNMYGEHHVDGMVVRGCERAKHNADRRLLHILYHTNS